MKIKKRRNLKNISSTMLDPVVKLSQQMSDEGLFVPQSSITIQNVIGEGQNRK